MYIYLFICLGYSSACGQSYFAFRTRQICHAHRKAVDVCYTQKVEANKIIITGGATRIGAAIAKKLSGSGVEIVIHYNKSKSNAEKLKKEANNLLNKSQEKLDNAQKENEQIIRNAREESEKLIIEINNKTKCNLYLIYSIYSIGYTFNFARFLDFMNGSDVNKGPSQSNVGCF